MVFNRLKIVEKNDVTTGFSPHLVSRLPDRVEEIFQMEMITGYRIWCEIFFLA